MSKLGDKIKCYSKKFLQDNGFKYNNYLSDFEDEIYTYKFPVVKYNKKVTIECDISVSTTTGNVNVNVYNVDTKELYTPYYDREYGDYEIVKLIDVKINNKLKELGIEQI